MVAKIWREDNKQVCRNSCQIQRLESVYLSLCRTTKSQMIDSEKVESLVPGQEAILLQSLKE